MATTEPAAEVGLKAVDKAARVRLAENTKAERVAASRVVLRYAHSRADLHELLDALGLNTTSKGEPQ
jgi:hypothetical protein